MKTGGKAGAIRPFSCGVAFVFDIAKPQDANSKPQDAAFFMPDTSRKWRETWGLYLITQWDNIIGLNKQRKI